MAAFKVGDLAVVKATGMGPVRVHAVNGVEVTVIVQPTPGSPADLIRCSASDLALFTKVESLSAWLPVKGGGWLSSRVVGHLGDAWRLETMDRNVDLAVSVPWLKPVHCEVNVEAMLRERMASARHELTARRTFRRWMADQGRVVGGLNAFHRTTVRPVRHQLAVALRVLSDPVLRFVLADEVGLGKTIEAGLIIHQYLLDSPGAFVSIVVPDHLADQWGEELRTKIRLLKSLSTNVRLLPFSRLRMVPRCDLLVVDEAHRLMGAESVADGTYAVLRTLAAASPGLLLLSATPIRSEVATFLRMMHLVDAQAYPLDDLDGFSERLMQRSGQASVLNVLAEGADQSLFDALESELTESLPTNHGLGDLLAVLRSGELSEEAFDAALADLVSQVRERFQIGRRVIRTRRTAELERDYPVAGRTFSSVALHDKGRPIVDRFLEEWRERARSAEASLPVGLFSGLLEAALAGGWVMRDWATARKNAIALGNPPAFETEVSLLDSLVPQMGRSDSRVDAVCAVLDSEFSRAGEKLVLATGSADRGAELFSRLRDRFGPNRVVAFLGGQSLAERRKSLDRFHTDNDTRVLVIDPLGEEGCNLQIGRRLINVDIPWSVNRLEQRIGRLDRHVGGRFYPCRLEVFDEPSSEFVSGVHAFLQHAVGVFDESVSTMQRALVGVLADMEAAIFREGPSALRRRHSEIRQQLADDRVDMERLESLEASDLRSALPDDLYDELVSYCEEWTRSQKVLDKITDSDGGLGLHRRKVMEDRGVFRYAFDDRSCKLPEALHGHLAKRFPAACTLNRARGAIGDEVELLSPMSPFLQWIAEYLAREDRGRVEFRHLLDSSSIRTTVRAEFEFEHRQAVQAAVVAERGARLPYLDYLLGVSLPPRIVTVDVDGDGCAAESVRPLYATTPVTLLQGPTLVRVMDPFIDWESTADRMTAGARSLALQQVQPSLDEARRLVSDEVARRRRILSASGALPAAVDDGALEVVLSAMATPDLTLRSVMVNFLSPERVQ